MSAFKDPFSDGIKLGSCTCGRHHSQAEHDAAHARAADLPVEANEEALNRRTIESAIMRAVFPDDRERRGFLRRHRSRPIVVLDIPLLFETGGEKRCDGVVVVTAPQFLQTQRVLKRPGMTLERFRQILKSQMPDAEKRRRADWVVDTGLGRRPTLAALAKVVRELKSDRFNRSR